MSIKIKDKLLGTLTMPRPEGIESFITTGIAITWDEDTIYLSQLEGSYFCSQLTEAEEDFTFQTVIFS